MVKENWFNVNVNIKIILNYLVKFKNAQKINTSEGKEGSEEHKNIMY